MKAILEVVRPSLVVNDQSITAYLQLSGVRKLIRASKSASLESATATIFPPSMAYTINFVEIRFSLKSLNWATTASETVTPVAAYVIKRT